MTPDRQRGGLGRWVSEKLGPLPWPDEREEGSFRDLRRRTAAILAPALRRALAPLRAGVAQLELVRHRSRLRLEEAGTEAKRAAAARRV